MAGPVHPGQAAQRPDDPDANVLPTTELVRALEMQDEAIRAAEPDGPDLPQLLSNRANRVTQAVRHSILPAESLLDGVADVRRALELIPGGHPSLRGITTNLSSLLAEGIHAGLLSSSHLPEALSLARRALTLTPHDSPDWPSCANNLAIRFQKARSLHRCRYRAQARPPRLVRLTVSRISSP